VERERERKRERERERERDSSMEGAAPFRVVVYGKAVLFRMAFRCFLADIDGQVRRVYI
jgi:hypothetical protein